MKADAYHQGMLVWTVVTTSFAKLVETIRILGFQADTIEVEW